MATNITKLKVGDTVWFYDCSILSSGLIVYLKDRQSSVSTHRLVCVETSNSLKVIEVDGGDRANIWTTSWEPNLKKAKDLQTQASNLLNDAAKLFSQSTTSQNLEAEAKTEELSPNP